MQMRDARLSNEHDTEVKSLNKTKPLVFKIARVGALLVSAWMIIYFIYMMIVLNQEVL
jgi:uncharacterized membrane protein YukC